MTTVTLSKPIEADGKTYTELTFREAQLGDFIVAERLGAGDLGRAAAVMASMANITLPLMQKLPMRDWNKILDEAGHLMGNDIPAESGD